MPITTGKRRGSMEMVDVCFWGQIEQSAIPAERDLNLLRKY